VPGLDLTKEHTAALEQLFEDFGTKAAETAAKSLMRDCSQLLRHCEAILLETTLGSGD
jgi:hypothetical protein